MDRQSGAAAVEYAILVGLIAVVIIGAVGALGAAIFPADLVARLGGALTGDPVVEVPIDPEPTAPDPHGGGPGPGESPQPTPPPTSVPTPPQCEKAPPHAKPPPC
jgi:Flp pilus assembly pilin Flp